VSKFVIIILICLGISFITYPSYAQRVSRRGVVVQDSGTTAGTSRTLNFDGDITVDCTTDASKCTLDTNAVEAVAAGDDYIINSGADTMTGDLTINKASPSIILKDTTSGPTTIEFQNTSSAQKAIISKEIADLLTIDAVGGVQLLHNGGARLTVDNAGVDVAGTLDVSGTITAVGDITGSNISGTNTGDYSHPTTAGNKHVPTGGAAGQFLKYSSSGTAVWALDNDTTYSVGDGGLTQINFTSADNSKLDGIEALADVTDATNVATAGALMDGDFTTTGFMRREGAGSYGVTSTINLASQVIGNLNKDKLNSGLNANSTTFWRGDGTWATPSGGGTYDAIKLNGADGQSIDPPDTASNDGNSITGWTTDWDRPAAGSSFTHDGTDLTFNGTTGAVVCFDINILIHSTTGNVRHEFQAWLTTSGVCAVAASNTNGSTLPNGVLGEATSIYHRMHTSTAQGSWFGAGNWRTCVELTNGDDVRVCTVENQDSDRSNAANLVGYGTSLTATVME